MRQWKKACTDFRQKKKCNKAEKKKPEMKKNSSNNWDFSFLFRNKLVNSTIIKTGYISLI